MSKKAILIIMDGWGKGHQKKSDAIQNANTPFYDSLFKNFPNSKLITCGKLVGLPDGQMGNSEVGHLNLGAGRIVYQELQRINNAIKTGELEKNQHFQKTLSYAKENKKQLHLIGLVSNGGVHSEISHLKALLNYCKKKGLTDVFVHAFTDGRDCDPKSGLSFIQEIHHYCQETGAKIATVIGRYYAMDRDKRWERVQKAYNAMVNAEGEKAKSPEEAVQQYYAKDSRGDEFILPTVIVNEEGLPIAKIQEGDAVLCFNFRTDRCREITQVLSQEAFPEFQMKPLKLYYTTMTQYDKKFKDINVIFKNDDLKNTLGEILEQQNKKQIRIAETEKYPHVTFFFSGGREKEFLGEKRIMISSPKVPTYDMMPEMSANEITEAILPELENETADFICLNFANTDMVGHTGVFKAAIKAAETVDQCVSKIAKVCLKKGYTIFLLADHGNSDYMINEDGTPNTAHTLNPVPFFVISNEYTGKLKNGKLGDIAPSILYWMQIPIPKEMTGDILIY
ncbi:MAG: 2,3-bisphosphoglycerate-independent phosphoglycerate mutase [Chitinophagaceae bacterium]